MGNLPNPNDFSRRDAVREAAEAKASEERNVEALREELEETRGELEVAKSDLADVKAEARIGDASESDVEDARSRVQSLKEKAGALTDEIETSERAVEKLENKVRQRENEAKSDIEAELREAYHDRLREALEKLLDAQEAVRAAGEVGQKLMSNRMAEGAAHNGHPTSPEGRLNDPRLGVAVATVSGNDVHITADDLKAEALRTRVITNLPEELAV